MRVLQLSKFYPPVNGGIETVAYELATALNRSGHPTDVLCSNTRNATVHESVDGYRVTRAASLGKLLSTSMAPALISELSKTHSQYDAIHVHLPDPMTNLALRFVKPSAKIIVHWHSDVVQQKVALKLYEPLQRWLLERADRIIATSEPYALTSPWLSEFIGKVRVVPIGTREPAAQTPAEVTALRARYPGKRIVFTVGRSVYYKGFFDLIAAAELLADDTMVIVGGTGPLLDALRQRVVERRLQSRIAFVGRISDEEMPKYYAAADLFCMTSTVRAEAFGVVLLEAMAASKPVVATDIAGSGVPWVNQHGVTGFNVPVGDAQAMATAIRRLLDDEALRLRLGQAARQRYLDHFTPDRMATATIDTYKEVVT